MNASDAMVVLAVITGAHGVHGRVKIKSFTEEPEDFLAYGPLHLPDGSVLPNFKITGTGKDHYICEIDGMRGSGNAREKAQSMKGTELSVPRAALPAHNDDEFYIEDLVGLAVHNEEGVLIGTVKAVQNFGAGDIVEIQFNESGKKELFPFKNEIFPTIDIAAGHLTFQQPETIIVKEETGG